MVRPAVPAVSYDGFPVPDDCQNDGGAHHYVPLQAARLIQKPGIGFFQRIRYQFRDVRGAVHPGKIVPEDRAGLLRDDPAGAFAVSKTAHAVAQDHPVKTVVDPSCEVAVLIHLVFETYIRKTGDIHEFEFSDL